MKMAYVTNDYPKTTCGVATISEIISGKKYQKTFSQESGEIR